MTPVASWRADKMFRAYTHLRHFGSLLEDCSIGLMFTSRYQNCSFFCSLSCALA